MDIRGAVTYVVRSDGSLEGRWVGKVDGKTDGRQGYELAVPQSGGAGSIAGRYHVDLLDPDGKPNYKGILEIVAEGPSFCLSWRPTTAQWPLKFDGVGLIAKSGELAAAYWLVD